ncbi:hypothetical protein Q428_15210 [Fervidicella metallireducens AeB]|uniref:DUF4926 domain-containing protein n=1 Tax=Fervidicella metallireducens AeB TaxID=1403537 RepID=A0A017RRP8_9CLOT|nr:DUF4926 domain-containing protein [Fervidicella metallireducens]EYE87119.1 hypothetical protein Q428_15210 [Fervidicella metallireducens AeB]
MKQFQKVRLLTDKYFGKYGIRKGDLGFTLEDYNDGNFEVEFSHSTNGYTIALLAIPGNELEVVEI